VELEQPAQERARVLAGEVAALDERDRVREVGERQPAREPRSVCALGGERRGHELARGGAARPLPYHTALGALGRHVAESSPERYQPSNVTWALIEDVVGRVKKIEKRERQAAKAIATVERVSA
jgi:hypothetical protein